jgi:hypothetical protein
MLSTTICFVDYGDAIIMVADFNESHHNYLVGLFKNFSYTTNDN